MDFSAALFYLVIFYNKAVLERLFTTKVDENIREKKEKTKTQSPNAEHTTAQCIHAHTYKQDVQLSQRDRAAGCVIVFAKSRRLEVGDNLLRTL